MLCRGSLKTYSTRTIQLVDEFTRAHEQRVALERPVEAVEVLHSATVAAQVPHESFALPFESELADGLARASSHAHDAAGLFASEILSALRGGWRCRAAIRAWLAPTMISCG